MAGVHYNYQPRPAVCFKIIVQVRTIKAAVMAYLMYELMEMITQNSLGGPFLEPELALKVVTLSDPQ